MKPADPILHCYTAKFKIAEAKYFLERMKTEEIFQDDNLFSFHLNAFVNSSYSVVEYVHSDFYFHKVKISWIEYDKLKLQGKSVLNQFLQDHPESKTIKNFKEKYDSYRDKLERNPLVNYFKFKRNKILHSSWSGDEFGYFWEKGITQRFLASTFKLDLRWQMNKNIPLDITDSRISDADQVKLLKKLERVDVKDICQEYVDVLENFISKFEGQDYFK